VRRRQHRHYVQARAAWSALENTIQVKAQVRMHLRSEARDHTCFMIGTCCEVACALCCCCCRFSPGYTNGLRGMRHYSKPTPSTWSDGGWRALGSRFRSPRWYPTQVRCCHVSPSMTSQLLSTSQCSVDRLIFLDVCSLSNQQ
jgi:hypothetical protein